MADQSWPAGCSLITTALDKSTTEIFVLFMFTHYIGQIHLFILINSIFIVLDFCFNIPRNISYPDLCTRIEDSC